MLLGELVGCGELADGAYLGEPLYALAGSVYRDAEADDEADGAELRVALFWANGGLSREERTTRVDTSFPAEYTLQIYAWPPSAVRFTADWDPSAVYAVAFPLVYADRDGDGRWDDDEAVLGGSADQVVVYAERGVEVTPPNGLAVQLPAGFSRATAVDGSALCELPANALTPTAEDAPTDLRVGPSWWQALLDWNCDGSLDEWDGLCPALASGAGCPGDPCGQNCDPATDPSNGGGPAGP